MVKRIPKPIWVAFGFIFVVIGTIGYLTPLMPGLVFFILASFCFAKGSYKFLRILLGNKYIGPQILDWKRGKGMKRKTKIIAIIMLVTSMSYSAFFMVKLVWVKWIIMTSAVAISLYILSIKTKIES